jgi:cytochrome P450
VSALRYPMRRASPLHPPPEYARLRCEQPVAPVRLWDGHRAWLVTRHADVRAALREPRLSASPSRPGYPLLSAARAGVAERQGSFNHLDGEAHRAQRRMVAGAFTLARGEALRPEIEEIVERRLDRLIAAGPPADLVQDLALPVASETICRLLGVPYRHHGFFERRSGMRFELGARRDTGQAERELLTWLDGLVTVRLERPRGLLGALARERVATGQLGDRALADMARLLLVNGYETTTNMVALAVVLLLQRPATAELVRDGPDEALVRAVEELLRHATIIHLAPVRAATEDLMIAGCPIRRGEGVILSLASANRDPDVFGAPDRLDLERDAGEHVAFGHGPHHCLGAALVRVQMAVVLRALMRRLPGLRTVRAPADLPFKHDRAVYGVHRLEVTW